MLAGDRLPVRSVEAYCAAHRGLVPADDERNQRWGNNFQFRVDAFQIHHRRPSEAHQQRYCHANE